LLVNTISTYPRQAISLTTTGSGTASYNNSTGVLNVPTPSGGTVSSVSGLTPLFTTANSTTTPTFSLSNAVAWTIFGNRTSGSATPSYFTNPYSDSLKVSADSIYQQVNGVWSYQFKARNLDTSFLNLIANNLGVTQVTNKGVLLQNLQVATSGNQQISPAITIEGQGWKTDATAASQPVQAQVYLIPTQGATNPTGNLLFRMRSNNGTWYTPFQITWAGTTNAAYSMPYGNLSVGANGTFGGIVTGNSLAGTLATINAGYTLNTSTDGLLITNTQGTNVTDQIQKAARIRFNGSAYTGAATNTVGAYIEHQPNSGTSPLTADLNIKSNINGGAYSINLSIGNLGNVSMPQSTATLSIGSSSPALSSILDITSTTKGVLLPRMTTTQVNAIGSPATGLGLYNTDAKMAMTYDGVAYKSDGIVSGSYSTTGAATTVFTVTFGGTQPNTTYKVNVTPTSVLAAALLYISNKTTTTFDVTYLAGLTGSVSFDYSITQ